MTNNFLIKANSIGKTYSGSDSPALSDVSLQIGRGEVVAVIGHNGAGKSTMFDILGSLSRPTLGSVESNLPTAQLGWCPQREIVDWSLTVRQNIALGYQLRTRASGSKVRYVVDEIAEKLGLAKFLDRTAETLSGGELRRTQIARAMVGEPTLLMLDEPTTGLDPEGIRVVFDYIDSCRDSGHSALISTHETSRFSSHCTRVIAINNGRIIADLNIDDYLSIFKEKTDDLWDVYVQLRTENKN